MRTDTRTPIHETCMKHGCAVSSDAVHVFGHESSKIASCCECRRTLPIAEDPGWATLAAFGDNGTLKQSLLVTEHD
jgi:hypothetical protein